MKKRPNAPRKAWWYIEPQSTQQDPHCMACGQPRSQHTTRELADGCRRDKGEPMSIDPRNPWWYLGESAGERPSLQEVEDAVNELTCPVSDTPGGAPCGKPAQRYPMPLGVSHLACDGHRLQFLAILGAERTHHG